MPKVNKNKTIILFFYFNSKVNNIYRRKSAVDIVAVVGTNKLDEGGDVYQAVRLRIHPLFSNKRILYDVGLVIVDRDIEFSEKVQSLEVGEEYVNGSTKVVLSGWGITTVVIFFFNFAILLKYRYYFFLL